MTAFAQENVVEFSPSIGHNSQRNFVREMMAAYDAIFQANADPQVTLIRLAIWRHTNWNDRTSRASQATLKRDCSGFASESTFKRHFPDAKKAFDLVPGGGRGRANVYAMKLDQTASELSTLMENRGQLDPSLNRGQVDTSFVNRGQSDTPLNRGQLDPSLRIKGGQLDPCLPPETRVKLTPPSIKEGSKKERVQCSHDAGVQPFEEGVRGGQTTRDKDRSGVGIAAVLTAALASAVVPMAAAAAQTPPNVISQQAVPYADLQSRLIDAAGPALANPAACPGLLSMYEPRRWIAAGIDMDWIALPVIRARCAAAKAGTIKSWGYFTQAIADAQATATAPMPAASAGRGYVSREDAEAERKRKRLRDMAASTGFDIDKYIRESAADKTWTKKAQEVWAASPAGAEKELSRLGIAQAEWAAWGVA